jgi:hypothetical protein
LAPPVIGGATAEETMWKLPLFKEKDDLIPVACLITLLPNFSWTYHDYLSRLLDVPGGDAPGASDGPFYFMRQDVIRGLCAATGMLLSLILVALTWKRFPKGSSTALWFGWLWSMPWVVDGLYTYCRSSHLMDPQRATAGWTTASAYIADPIRHTAMFLAMLVAVALGFLLRRYRGEDRMERRPDCANLGAAS